MNFKSLMKDKSFVGTLVLLATLTIASIIEIILDVPLDIRVLIVFYTTVGWLLYMRYFDLPKRN
jgi:hypothetical protein